MERLGDVCILGLGASGDAAARYCAGLLGTGCDSVTVFDGSDSQRVSERAAALEALGVRVLLGTQAVAGRYDLCIASPGIAPHWPLMASARSCCESIISELEFAYRASSGPWVAVTGTNGKTTTTSLVTHLLESAGISARAVGNIGLPAISAVGRGDADEVLVAEVSSFQLALTERFQPRVAVLLNITPDHVDWHGSLERYAADKARVFENLRPGDVAVIDVDDPGSAPYAVEVENRGISVIRVSRSEGAGVGAYLADGVLTLSGTSGAIPLIPVSELRIRGSHNVSNALAGAAAAHAMGAPPADIARGLAGFEPIEHRLEPVGTFGGVEWFNDSKATNPDAVFKAIEAFADRPFVLLLGGRSKGSDFGALAAKAAGTARGVIVFGEAADEIAAAFRSVSARVIRSGSLRDAVDAALNMAAPGDAVVLSPACASFDEFDDYEHRGRAFKDLVAGVEGRESR